MRKRVILGALLAFAWPGSAGLESGVYQTVPGATVVETGDNVPNGSRIVPRSATLTFDLTGDQPSLGAVIHDAVLEGGSPYGDFMTGDRKQPFQLTVWSSSGWQLQDGSYRFTGDYLQEIRPEGSQYIFDWQFSSDSDGRIVWNGYTCWAGGHIWMETISEVLLVPEPSTLGLIMVGVLVLKAYRGRILKNARYPGNLTA